MKIRSLGTIVRTALRPFLFAIYHRNFACEIRGSGVFLNEAGLTGSRPSCNDVDFLSRFFADLCFNFFFKLGQENFKRSHPNHMCVTGHVVPPTTIHLHLYFISLVLNRYFF